MYWDNNKIADYIAVDSARKENAFLETQRRYINDDLFIIKATWTFTESAFREDGEYKKVVQRIISALDDAVYDANRTIDDDMELDEDYTLSMIETDDYIEVVGMSTVEGAFLIENVLLDAKKYGIVKFNIK